MVIPFIMGAGGAIVSHFATKKAQENIAEEKIELVAELIKCSPEQADVVRAIKGKSLDELRFRVQNGIGPLAPLPANASIQAQANRTARIAARDLSELPASQRNEIIKSVSRLSDAEKARINAAPNKQEAIKQLIDEKVAEAGAAAAVSVPPSAPPPSPSGPVEMVGPEPPSGTSESVITDYESSKYNNTFGAQYSDFEGGNASF